MKALKIIFYENMSKSKIIDDSLSIIRSQKTGSWVGLVIANGNTYYVANEEAKAYLGVDNEFSLDALTDKKAEVETALKYAPTWSQRNNELLNTGSIVTEVPNGVTELPDLTQVKTEIKSKIDKIKDWIDKNKSNFVTRDEVDKLVKDINNKLDKMRADLDKSLQHKLNTLKSLIRNRLNHFNVGLKDVETWEVKAGAAKNKYKEAIVNAYKKYENRLPELDGLNFWYSSCSILLTNGTTISPSAFTWRPASANYVVAKQYNDTASFLAAARAGESKGLTEWTNVINWNVEQCNVNYMVNTYPFNSTPTMNIDTDKPGYISLSSLYTKAYSSIKIVQTEEVPTVTNGVWLQQYWIVNKIHALLDYQEVQNNPDTWFEYNKNNVYKSYETNTANLNSVLNNYGVSINDYLILLEYDEEVRTKKLLKVLTGPNNKAYKIPMN